MGLSNNFPRQLFVRLLNFKVDIYDSKCDMWCHVEIFYTLSILEIWEFPIENRLTSAVACSDKENTAEHFKNSKEINIIDIFYTSHFCQTATN